MPVERGRHYLRASTRHHIRTEAQHRNYILISAEDEHLTVSFQRPQTFLQGKILMLIKVNAKARNTHPETDDFVTVDKCIAPINLSR